MCFGEELGECSKLQQADQTHIHLLRPLPLSEADSCGEGIRCSLYWDYHNKVSIGELRNHQSVYEGIKIIVPSLSSPLVLATVFPCPPLKLGTASLQCGCSGKPVDYPNCFMTKAYPTIMLLCHWEITYSQTRTLRHTLTDTLRRHKAMGASSAIKP